MILTTKIALASNAKNIVVDPNDPTATPVDELKVLPKVLSGPTTILSGTDAVFTLDEYTYKNVTQKQDIETPTAEQQVLLDVDKDEIKWSFWVSGGLMDNPNTFVPVNDNRTLQNEANENFTQTNSATTFLTNVTDSGYIEATIGTIIVDGVKKNQLTIKFSKWLDGKTIYVEPYRNGPEHDSTNNFTQATTLNAANPEIIDLYWLNQQKERVTATGFETALALCIETIGLRNKTVDLSLHDTETFDNTIDWNGDTQKTVTVTDYKTVIPYQVLQANFTPPFIDITRLFVKVASTEVTTLQTDFKAPITLSLKTEILRLFFANKKYSQLDNNYYYEQVTSAHLGNLVYLVAECTNMNGDAIIFSLKETASRLVAVGNKLTILEHQEEEFTTFVNYTNQLLFPRNIFADLTDNLTAEVENNFASVAINFHELGTPQYNAWDQILNTFNPSQTELFIEAQLASVTNPDVTQGTTNKLSLKTSGSIVQHIYHTGHLNKVTYQEGIAKKVNYIYHAADGKTHDLGIFDIVWAQRWKDDRVDATVKPAGVEEIDYVKRIKTKKNGTKVNIYFEKDGTRTTPLVTIFSGGDYNTLSYIKDGKEVNIITENTDREYFNPERLAAIIGAIFNTGYTDVVTNGSVGIDATGSPSVSHINGNNIDFKYLRLDGKRPWLEARRIFVNENLLLAKDRQNILLNSFYDFGFGRSKKNYSHYLNSNNDVLDHCIKYGGHDDHLHLQGFVAQYK